MAAYIAPTTYVDPVEKQINDAFDQMRKCLEQRRKVVLRDYQVLKRGKTTEFPQTNPAENVMDQPKLNTRIVFHSDTILLRQLIAELGNVFVELSTSPNYSGMKAVEAVGNVGKRGRAEGELYSPHAVAVDQNNRIFVTEGDASEPHSRISVFSVTGDCLSNFTHQDMREPCGLATHGDYLYVTDTELHTIFQFKMDSQLSFMTKQGTRGSLIGHFNYPRNLTVSASGNVYVADCKNNRVQILNNSLHHIRNLTEQPIYLPHDIKLTADEVYVLCAGNPCVHVFSHAGEVIRSLISTGTQLGMTEPLYFCLDAAENIIISDYSAHRIKIFTKDGDLKKTVGEEGHQPGMFRYPTGLALTKELNLVVVSCNKNYTFQIFSSQ